MEHAERTYINRRHVNSVEQQGTGYYVCALQRETLAKTVRKSVTCVISLENKLFTATEMFVKFSSLK